MVHEGGCATAVVVHWKQQVGTKIRRRQKTGPHDEPGTCLIDDLFPSKDAAVGVGACGWEVCVCSVLL